MENQSDTSISETPPQHFVSKHLDQWRQSRESRPKTLLHEFVAEMFGTAVALMFGCGVVASKQMQMANILEHQDDPLRQMDEFGADLWVHVAWALGFAIAIIITFESTGAHLNPAVTFTNMIFAGMSPFKGLVYMAAQMLGAALGAAVVTINYVSFKGADALTNFYCTSPYEGVSNTNAFFTEALCTFLLLAGFFGIASGNPPVNKFHVAGAGAGLILAIGNAFGAMTGFAMNPARDFGPRVVYAVVYMAYGGQDVATDVFGGTYWLIPLLAPFVGAPLGALAYQLANHPEPEVSLVPATNAGFAKEESAARVADARALEAGTLR